MNAPFKDNTAGEFWGGEDQFAQPVCDGRPGAGHHVHNWSRVQDQGNTG